MTNSPVLRRDASARVVGGVCSGLARWWGVDPVLVRAALVVLTIVSSGLSVLAYLTLWLVLPSDASRVRRPRLTPKRLALLAIVVSLGLGLMIPASRFAAAAYLMIGLAVFAWYRTMRRTRGTSRRIPPSPAAQPINDEHIWTQPPSSPSLITESPRVNGGSSVPRPARRLVWGVMSAVTVLVLAAGVWASFGPSTSLTMDDETTVISDAAALPPSIDAGTGRKVIDLRGLVLDHDRTLTITQDMGTLTVLLPAKASITAKYSLDVGSLTSPTTHRRGFDVTATDTFVGEAGQPTLTLDIVSDMGAIEVKR